jgi:hypothetical protein
MQCHVEMTPEMIASWLESGADEIGENLRSPAVMPVQEIRALVPERLGALSAAADRLYARWMKGLKA